MAWIEHEHPDPATLIERLLPVLTSAAQSAISARDRATFVLAGGNTPLPLYRQWAQTDLPWSKITVLASDERCVAHDHPACNARALAEVFAAAEGVDLQPLTTADGDPDRSQPYARGLLAATPGPFDLVLLGMGSDGHTASLFPGAAQLQAGLAADAPDALRVDPQPLPPEAPFPRISLSAARLLRTHLALLLITGAGKREVLRSAQANADPQHHPIAALLHAAAPPLHIHWSP